MPKQILKRKAACLRSGGRMLSRIRFSCSLAAADGPWEETTDEAEKTSLRTLSRFGKERSWTSWKPSIWTFSRMARIVFFNIQALRASLQVRRFAKMQLIRCSCFQVFHQTQFSKWNSGFCSFLLKTSSPKKRKLVFRLKTGFSHLPRHLRG